MKLTPAEFDVLKWIADGKTCRDIAQIRDRAVKTVMNQAEKIRAKLEANSLAHAVAIAMRRRILK